MASLSFGDLPDTESALPPRLDLWSRETVSFRVGRDGEPVTQPL